MRVKRDAPFRVIQISDTHVKAQPNGQLWGVDVDVALQAVLERLKAKHWPPALLLATGDLVHDEGATGYRRWYSLFEPLGVPVYCLPGNHDTPALADVLASGRVRLERRVNTGAWQFILLDSCLPGSDGGHLAERELLFLQRTLEAHPQTHTMVCLHHHPVPVGSPWIDTMVVDNAEALFAILERHSQVRAVIWGHIHQSFAARRNGIELLAAPATCVQFKPGVEEPEIDDLGPGYRWFELYGDGTLKTGIERVDDY